MTNLCYWLIVKIMGVAIGLAFALIPTAIMNEVYLKFFEGHFLFQAIVSSISLLFGAIFGFIKAEA